MRNAKSVKAHLYLEGYEVNFLNIAITEADGAPPTAEVVVPAYPGILNILPKTIGMITVELPLRDDKGNYLFTQTESGDVLTYSEYVLFYGQLSGYGFSRSGFQSAATIVFTGFTGEWDKNPIVPIAMNIPTLLQSVFLGVSSVGANSKYGIFYQGYPSVLLSYTNILQGHLGGTQKWIADAATNRIAVADNLNTMLHDREYPFYKNGSLSKIDTFAKLLTDPQTTMGAAKPILSNALIRLAKSLEYLLENMYHESTGYLYMLSRATNINIMTQYINSEILRDVIIQDAVVDYFSRGMQGLQGNEPISSVIKFILAHMFYDYIEFAAPTLIPDPDPNRAGYFALNKIMVKPRTTMFSPIGANVIFDDDIIQTNITRAFDSEPTRLINLTKTLPTQDSAGNLPLSSLMATIAPQGVLATDVLKIQQETSNQLKTDLDKQTSNGASPADVQKFIDAMTQQQTADYSPILASDQTINQKNIKNFQILGYTYEEVLRGVIPTVNQDEYNSEYSFILGELQKKYPNVKSANDITQDMMIGTLDTVYNVFTSRTNSGDAFVRYSANLANFLYHEARRQPRTGQAVVDFSPFHLVGFPAVLGIKETGPIVGYVVGNQISISANGTAQQVLSFSHLSPLNVDSSFIENGLETLADAYQDISPTGSADLNYFSEFAPQSVGKNLYVFATGTFPSSLYDFCLATKGLAPKNNTRLTAQCVNNIMTAYYAKTDKLEADAFVYQLTHRRLATMAELMASLANNTTGFDSQTISDRIQTYDPTKADTAGPHPFIDVRQQAIQKIFAPESPQLWWTQKRNGAFVKGII